MSPLAQEAQEVLRNHAAQEFIDQIIDGLNALHEHMYVDHELLILNALAGEDGPLIMEAVFNITQEALVDVCKLHRVKVDIDSNDLLTLSKFVRALQAMQYWEEVNAILDLCHSDATNEDKLASIVGLVGEITESDALNVIQDVDDTLMVGLERIYSENALSVEEEHEIDPEQIAKLRSWRDHAKAHTRYAYRMVKAGYKPGYAFNEYAKRVAARLVSMDNIAIAEEVIPLLLLGRDTWRNPLISWREHNAIFSFDAGDITAIDTIIVRLLSDFETLTKGTKQ